ncbi:DNA-binding protein [Kribbella sp. NPDC056861]|uniref:DNA-binding protein n=1 Tax=Kribbella sp. NPDC056861 TaxID=3154857 RepID=UPI00342A9C04
MEQTENNLRQQTELYGEPLGTLMRRIGGTLGLTQARLAETIGLSAPMLSQLMSGQRVKIGNPAVVSRLQRLDLLVARINEQGLEQAQIALELTEISGSTGAFTRPTSITPAGADLTSTPPPTTQRPSPRDVVREIQNLLRGVASADEILQASKLIADQSPALAELLLTYGAGRTDDALAHYERHR